MQSRGILTALRAAAIVIIATGLNDVLAGALPRYEPLYLYLAAVALVVVLDGMLLGALTAIGAIAFYALLFMPRPAALSKAVLVPFGAAVATVVVAGIVRGILRVRTRSVAVAENGGRPTPLLMPPIVIDHGEVLTAIDELRGELRSTLSDASQKDARVAELERALANERAAHETDAARIAKLELALADERTAREAGVNRLTELDAALEAARAETTLRSEELRGELRSTLLDVSQKDVRVAELERALANERTAHETDAARIANLEHALADERTAREAGVNRLAELDAALEVARAETTLRSDELAAIRAAAADLRRTIDVERARADGEREIRTTAVERVTELERTLTARDSEAVRLQERTAELQQLVAEERALRERLELDGQSRDAALTTLRGRLHVLEQTLESTRERAADQERLLRVRIQELEESLVSDLQTRDAEIESQRARIDALQSELESERASSDQKLNTIMVHLAQDHEADLGKAVEEREEARAEARSLAMRVGVLQKKLEDQRLALDDATRLLAETRVAAQQEIDRLHARVVAVEKPPVVRPRILIAHPDADLRRNAGASLERAGYEIVSAADGLEALRTAIAQSPAVVIADAIMPKMDGRELCQLLKSQEKTAHIRVILLTRSTDAPPKGDLMPDHVLRKPVPLETLKTTLAALLA